MLRVSLIALEIFRRTAAEAFHLRVEAVGALRGPHFFLGDGAVARRGDRHMRPPGLNS